MSTSLPPFKPITPPKYTVDWKSANSYLTVDSKVQMESPEIHPDISGELLQDEMVFPQAIAHRGYQAQYPENTMVSFMGAINVGAHAIETDIHVTRDNVVVLSHDPTLLRCFGVEKRIRDCDFSYIQTLRTLKKPSQEMSTLRELLTLFRQPEVSHMWLLLDVKMDNDPDLILQLISELLTEIGGEGAEAWGGRVVMGVWALKYVSLCHKYLPGFPITHIGASIAYARQFLRIPGISFNIHHAILVNEAGVKFIKDARASGRNVFTWTVNDNRIMKWSMCQRLNGVCVDDPPDYFRMSLEYTPAWNLEPCWGWKKDMELRSVRLVAWIFVFLMRWKYCGGMKGVNLERELLNQQVEAASRTRRVPVPVVATYSDANNS